MPNQFFNGPAPQQADFDTLSNQIANLNTKVTKDSLDISQKDAFSGDVLTLSDGTYRVSNTSSNLPISENYFMIVIQRNSNLKVIIAISDSGNLYINVESNNTWTGWKLAT